MKSNFNAPAKAILFALILLVSTGFQQAFAQQFLTTIDGWNAYVHLPDDYNDGTGKKYPLICFIPGTGEVGTNASLLLSYGPNRFVASGNTMQFMVNGKLEKPIVISLQPAAIWPSASTINKKLDSVLARYRCDLQRVNLTGLSMGGWAWDNFVDGYNTTYTNKITSIVSMSSPEPDNTVSNMRFYAQNGGSMWSFEGNQDLRGNDKIRDTMNYYVPGSNRYTLYSGGHCCWNTFYDPTWVENGESIYTWMLKQTKLPGYSSPQANAGNDSTIINAILNLALKGSGNDPNGLTINFAWTKIAGPLAGNIVNPTSLQTSVSGLATGIYKFELKVTNSVGMVGKDTLLINNGLTVLPVKLTEFTAKIIDKKNVLLQWKTTAEVNADHFVVEKADNPQLFSEGGRLAAKALNGLDADYSFTDYFPENGVNYYRLKMVDKDGQFTYSKVVSVSLQKTKDNATTISSLYVKSNQLLVNIYSFKSQQGSVNITDAGGKRIYSLDIPINKGINNITKSLSLPVGVYYVNLSAGTERMTKAFIMQ
ncbi:MAG: hypothetical protein ABJA37_05475 [Ferruginibacter sp.]